MKRLIAALAVAVLVAAPAFAQTAASPIATLSASGQGTAMGAPNIVIIDIGVSTRGDTPAAAMAQNNTDMQAVIDAVLAAGVAQEDISTSNFSIYPAYADLRPDETQQRIVGYEVNNQVSVRIHGVEGTSTILDQVVAAGANQINGIRFDIEDRQALEDNALIAAIADAQRRAELMATAAGVELVRIVSVSTAADSPILYDRANFAAAMPATPIMGGQQAVDATATVVYEIAPLE